jgi:hypothetical protein
MDPEIPDENGKSKRGIQVTGVIQVGDELLAIVKAPKELTARYVRVGQRINNGEVLVKRIEMRDNQTPVVVLQKKGREVRITVGETVKVGSSGSSELGV